MALIATDREDLEPGVQPAPGLVGTVTTAPLLGDDDEFAGYDDYFGFDEQENVFLPDGKQYLRIRKMTEGDRSKYLKATRSDVRLNQRSGDAVIPFDQGGERKQLIVASVVNWHVVKKNERTGKFELAAFSKGNDKCALEMWIDGANPAILAHLEKRIRLANPWLLNEMSVEQIDKEIADLQELRKAALERESEGKDS